MLVQRRKHWTNIKTALVQRVAFSMISNYMKSKTSDHENEADRSQTRDGLHQKLNQILMIMCSPPGDYQNN